MARRFVRKTNPNIKELMEEEECGCAQRLAPWLPQISVAPCTETRVTGQVLTDTGFETQLTTFGGGPNGDEVPRVTSHRNMEWPSDSSSAWTPTQYDNPLPFSVINRTVGQSDWNIVTTDPRTGTYHLRHAATTNQVSFQLCRQGNCTAEGVEPGHFGFIVAPGDIAVSTVYMKVASTAGTPNITMTHSWNNASGFNITTMNTVVNLTTGYTAVTLQSTAPAGSRVLTVNVQKNAVSTIYDADDPSVTIT